jgi:hypothetical protein
LNQQIAEIIVRESRASYHATAGHALVQMILRGTQPLRRPERL